MNAQEAGRSVVEEERPGKHGGQRAWRTVLCALVLVSVATASLEAQCGDADGNGSVDVVDALVIAQHASALNPITGPRLLFTDVDSDGDTDITDALQVASFAAGRIGALNCLQCGDGDADSMPGTNADLGVLLAFVPTPMSSTPAVTSAQAALDTNGDQVLDNDDVSRFVTGNYSCSTCSDCNLDGVFGAADPDDPITAAAGLASSGLPMRTCDLFMVSPGTVDILDAQQIAAFHAAPPGATVVCADSSVASP